MKKVILFGLVIIIINGCSQRLPVEGVWELVFSSGTSGGELYPDQYPGYQVKIWTEGHFAYIGHFSPEDTLMQRDYGWGTFSLNGDRYEEFYRFNSNPLLIGSAVRMNLMIRNDTLIISWPTDENWELMTVFNIQKYVRLEAPEENR